MEGRYTKRKCQMKEMLKLGFVLAVFAGVACVALALVNQATAPVIAANENAKLTAGLAEILPAAKSYKDGTFTPDGSNVSVDNCNVGFDANGAVIGCVVQVSGPTYDQATVLVGVDSSKTLTGIKILAISDTPGFGQKATEPAWYGQFAGKPAECDWTLGTDFDAVSGATITSKGFSALLKTATKAALEAMANAN